MKNFFIILIPIIGLYFLTEFFIEIKYKLLIFILLQLITPIIPLTVRIIVLSNTKYNFYKNHLIKEFKFLSIKQQSIPYKHITNISINISLWDRLSNAGDIILHTAEDETPDLILQYVKNPKALEKKIYKITHQN